MTTPILASSECKARRVKLFSILAAFSLALLLFVVYRDAYMHFSAQSRQCAVAARSLLDRGTLELHRGRPYAIYGPLYPVLLAGLGSLRVSLSDAIVVLNSAALSLSLLTFYWIARSVRFPHPLWITALYAALAINPYLFRMARSDGLFVALTMIAVFSLARFASSGRKADLFVAALAIALATTARYMGVFPLAPLCSYVFVKMRRPRHPKEWLVAAAFFFVAWIPISVWLLRNKILTGYFLGMSREAWNELASSANPLANFLDILRTMAFDLLGVRVMGVYQVITHGNFTPHRALTSALVIAVATLLGMGLVVWLARRKTSPRAEAEEERKGVRDLLELVGVYVLLYVTAMVIIWSWGNNDAISTRYVAPMDWGIVILGAHLWFRLRSVRAARLLRAAMLATAMVVLVLNVDKSIRLFGNFPEEALIQKNIQQGTYVWIRNPTWEREARFAPAQPKLRVVDE